MSAAEDISQEINQSYYDIEIPSFGSKYTNEQRINAAYLFLLLGNLNKVSNETNIPQKTLWDWSKTEWWQHLTTKLRIEKQDEIDSTLTRVTDRAMQAIENKLENEDDYSIVEAAKVYGIMFDKQRLLRNQPTSISSNVSNDALKALKAQFEALAGKTIEGETISDD